MCTAVVYMELMMCRNVHNIVESHAKHSNPMLGSYILQ